MTININQLRRLAQAVSGWSNCNQAWLDQSEDVQAAVVGHIDEDGNTYPVSTIDCDQYHAAHQSLPLAKFYAAANPATIAELLDRLEAAEKERDELRTELNEIRYGVAVAHDTIKALRAKVAEMEKQEPVAWRWELKTSEYTYVDKPEHAGKNARIVPLYALPGAQPAPSIPDDVMRDAKRYRFLRAAKNIPISTEAARDPIVYDAAIDAAMLARAPEAKS